MKDKDMIERVGALWNIALAYVGLISSQYTIY